MHEEEGELAHDDMLRAHRNDGGGGSHEAVEVDAHLAMFKEHLADLESVNHRAAQRGDIDVARFFLALGQLIADVVCGEGPADGRVDVDVVGHCHALLYDAKLPFPLGFRKDKGKGTQR